MVQKLMMKPEHVFLGDLSVLAIWGDTSCFLSLCLPPKPVLNSSEATYNVSIPWVVCSSKNPHSFIGWTQAMFSKPFCKRQGWFAFILGPTLRHLEVIYATLGCGLSSVKKPQCKQKTTLISC